MIRRPPPRTQRWRWGVGLALLATGGVALGVHRGADSSPPVVSPAISKEFLAAGGPITAVVTVAVPGFCEVDLIGPHGAVLARGRAGGAPLTLRVSAAAGTPLSLVLRARGGRAWSWQAELRGVHS